MCREYVDRARTLGHPLSVQMSLVLLGLAELAPAISRLPGGDSTKSGNGKAGSVS
jgi:hypothetical protein